MLLLAYTRRRTRRILNTVNEESTKIGLFYWGEGEQHSFGCRNPVQYREVVSSVH